MKIELDLTTEQKCKIRKLLNSSVRIRVRVIGFTNGKVILEGIEALKVTWTPYDVILGSKKCSIYKDTEDTDYYLILE